MYSPSAYIGTAFLWHGRPLKKAKNGVHLYLGGHYRLKRRCQEGVLPGRLRIWLLKTSLIGAGAQSTQCVMREITIRLADGQAL